jgi:hypothetical protein
LSGGIPGAGTWTVKNLFELKNAKNVVVDGNLLENNWTDAQTGYAVLFTVRNQDGSAPWSTVEAITFTNNIVRHARRTGVYDGTGVALCTADDQLRLHPQHGSEQSVRVHRRRPRARKGLNRCLSTRLDRVEEHHRRCHSRKLPDVQPAMRQIWRDMLSNDVQWQSNCVNFSGANYRLLASSPYADAGSGATDLGADIDAILIASSGTGS